MLSPERRARIGAGRFAISAAVVETPIGSGNLGDHAYPRVQGAVAASLSDPWELAVPIAFPFEPDAVKAMPETSMLYIYAHSAEDDPDARVLIASASCAISLNPDDEPRRQRVLLATPEGAQGTMVVYSDVTAWGAPDARAVAPSRARPRFDGSGPFGALTRDLNASSIAAEGACTLALAAAGVTRELPPPSPMLSMARECAFQQRATALAIYIDWLSGISTRPGKEIQLVVHVGGISVHSEPLNLVFDERTASEDGDARYRVVSNDVSKADAPHASAELVAADAAGHAFLSYVLADSAPGPPSITRRLSAC